MTHLVIVPVRAGSQRVPQKNTKPFNNTNLLSLKLQTLCQVPEFEGRILVTTDCPEARRIALGFPGVRVHTRDSYYASSACSNADFFQNLADIASENVEHLVYAPVTAPFITPATYRAAWKFYSLLDPSKYDSLMSVQKLQQQMWVGGRTVASQPLNFADGPALKSQQLPVYWGATFGVAIARVADVKRWRNIFGPKPWLWEVTGVQALDIDHMADFEFAELCHRALQGRNSDETMTEPAPESNLSH